MGERSMWHLAPFRPGFPAHSGHRARPRVGWVAIRAAAFLVVAFRVAASPAAGAPRVEQAAVAGYVTWTITDQPFENALKLIMRSASLPLTYTRESGVFIVKPRPLDTGIAPPPVSAPDQTQQTRQYQPYEQIQLTYIDAA